jgi:uncharacterized membrane protein YqgA involved in biofilm formation
MRGLGTIINTATVVVGGLVGLVVGRRIPERVREIVVQVIGLVTLALGARDAIGTHNMVFPLVGMVVGAILGELLGIERRLEALGVALQRRVAPADTVVAGAGVGARDPGASDGRFVRGFVTATLLYCVGPLTILGAIQDASGETPQFYIVKGTLDGFMTIVFAATYGVGAIFSAASVFVVQGSLTLVGTGLDALLDARMRTELFAAGGLAVIAIGLNLLQIARIRLANLLPGLVVTPVLVAIFAV